MSSDLLGRVNSISADIVSDPDTRMSYYRVEIILLQSDNDDLEHRLLVPGMPAEVFLTTNIRTPLVWLTQPLHEYFSRAMRES